MSKFKLKWIAFWVNQAEGFGCRWMRKTDWAWAFVCLQLRSLTLNMAMEALSRRGMAGFSYGLKLIQEVGKLLPLQSTRDIYINGGLKRFERYIIALTGTPYKSGYEDTPPLDDDQIEIISITTKNKKEKHEQRNRRNKNR